MRARRLFVLTAMLAPGGCDYFASPDQLADPDVVTIAMVLVAGESQAQLLAGGPFLDRSDPPPRVTATLIGPRWRAAFTHETDPWDGCGGGPTGWSMPMVCLNATLPGPIREEVAYRLEGRGPKGSFTGETVVPIAPSILAPGDTVWLSGPTSPIRIPVTYRVPPEVGTLRPEVLQTVGDSSGTESKWVWAWPEELDWGSQVDTINWSYERNFLRASLHLRVIGRHYTYFWNRHRQHVEWPKAGLSGKGVYGYFDGSAKSRPVEVRLRGGG